MGMVLVRALIRELLGSSSSRFLIHLLPSMRSLGELINPEINGRFPKFGGEPVENGARTADGKLPSAITRPMTKLPLFNLPTMRPDEQRERS